MSSEHLSQGDSKIVTRKFAIDNGLKRYFNGKPCMRGHVSERFVTSALCVECNNLHNKKKWEEKKDELKEKNKQWRKENKEYILQKNKDWKEKNKEKVKQSGKNYYEKNKQKLEETRKAWYEKNKDKCAGYSKKYMEKNKERKNLLRKEWRKKRIETDELFRAIEKIRCVTIDAFRRKGKRKEGKTSELLGCSIQQAMDHIEKQFLEGMSWLNHGEWHIDHIIPLSSAKSIDEIIKLSHYTNLQPLRAKDNMKKGAKIL